MEHMIKENAVKMSSACEYRMYEEMAKFGAYFSSKCGISPGTAISLILGCVLLYMIAKRCRRETEPLIFERSSSIARLYGGDLALRRLDEAHVANVLPNILERSDLVLKGLVEEEHLDLKKLQIVTARLEMAGREEDGVKILKEAKKKNAELEKSHLVYEIDMLLVESLIYMGRHDEAQKCECLKHQQIIEPDARRPFFKAIIYGMQENWERAEQFWDKFIYQRQVLTQGEPLLQITDFCSFKQKVQHLQKQIEEKKKTSVAKKSLLMP